MEQKLSDVVLSAFVLSLSANANEIAQNNYRTQDKAEEAMQRNPE